MGRGAIGFLLLGLAACGTVDQGPPRRPPTIAFAETAVEFGRIDQGTPVNHDFHFANRGDLDLLIERLRSGCGGTMARSTAPTLPAGGEGTIRVTLDTATLAGPQRATVTVYTNDPAAPFTVLTLAGEVAADVAAEPPQLYVGHVRGGAAARSEVVVLTAETVRIDAIDSDAEVFTARGRALDDGRRGQRIGVVMAERAPPGRFTQEIRVRTTSPRHPVLRIPVVGVVDDPAAAGFSPPTPR